MLLIHYRSKAKNARPIKPLTSLAEEIARDLTIPVQEDGRPVATDCSGVKAEIILPTHQTYNMDIVERIKQRYDMILSAEMTTEPSL
jgi:segregation and condensation protein B